MTDAAQFIGLLLVLLSPWLLWLVWQWHVARDEDAQLAAPDWRDDQYVTVVTGNPSQARRRALEDEGSLLSREMRYAQRKGHDRRLATLAVEMERVERALARLDGTEGWTCPRCGHTSHHSRDREEGYCGRCSWWTDPDVNPSLAPYASKMARPLDGKGRPEAPDDGR